MAQHSVTTPAQRDLWRAGCSQTGMVGSEDGSGKRTGRKPGIAP
jgi:hypothetical protein